MKTGFFTRMDSNQVQCDLCPRLCIIPEGKRGFCFVRKNINGDMHLTTYGRVSGFAMDPIEKKPLNHFLPGSKILSFGTPGCNLACRHCQNSSLSRAREMDPFSQALSPQDIASIAMKKGAASVAFTYNDPVVFAEFAVDTALVCQANQIRTVAVTAGYISDKARSFFFSVMDAANVDLKSIRPEFYKKTTSGSLEPVLETLLYLKLETTVWFEITNLLIPGVNDSDSEIDQLSNWIVDKLGPQIPLHFTAFHPAYKMHNLAPTPINTLLRAKKIASDNGVQFVYLGNCQIPEASDTFCPTCKTSLISREGYSVSPPRIDPPGNCQVCKTPIPGHWFPLF